MNQPQFPPEKAREGGSPSCSEKPTRAGSQFQRMSYAVTFIEVTDYEFDFSRECSSDDQIISYPVGYEAGARPPQEVLSPHLASIAVVAMLYAPRVAAYLTAVG